MNNLTLSKFIPPKALKLMKNFAITWALVSTLASCGNYESKYENPQFVSLEDKTELVSSSGKHIRVVKHRWDTGSPSHLIDHNGRQIIQDNLISFTKLWSWPDLWLVTTDGGKWIYNIETNKYLLPVDNYTIISNIWSSWLIKAKQASVIWWEYVVFDTVSWSKISSESDPEILSANDDMIAKTAGTYKIYDNSLTIVQDLQSSKPYSRDGNNITYTITDPVTWADTQRVYNITTPTVAPVAVTWPSHDIQLSGSYSAQPTGSGGYYNIVNSAWAMVVRNCYKPTDQWSSIEALTFLKIDALTGENIYMLHTINTSSWGAPIKSPVDYKVAQKYIDHALYD